MDGPHESIVKVCRDVLGPLVKADGGVLYLVSVSPEDVHIHLAGTCAGCPGAAITRDRMLEPAIASLLPKAKLRVTTGWRVPEGAEKFG
ncbi:MAG: NifU family protein [Polyangiaceae bacterium]